MGGTIVDLTLDDSDDDVSPNKAAQNALRSFLPRKEKTNSFFTEAVRDGWSHSNHESQTRHPGPSWSLPAIAWEYGSVPTAPVVPTTDSTFGLISSQSGLSLSALLQQESIKQPQFNESKAEDRCPVLDRLRPQSLEDSHTERDVRKDYPLGHRNTKGESSQPPTKQGKLNEARPKPKFSYPQTQPDSTDPVSKQAARQVITRKSSPPSPTSARPLKRQKHAHKEPTNEPSPLWCSRSNELYSAILESPKADSPVFVKTSSSPATKMLQERERQPKLYNEATAQDSINNSSVFGTAWTTEEDALLKKLKEDERLDWASIEMQFRGRTLASLRVRYSKLKKRPSATQPIPQKTQSDQTSVDDLGTNQPSKIEGTDLLGQVERTPGEYISQVPNWNQPSQVSGQGKIAAQAPTANKSTLTVGAEPEGQSLQHGPSIIFGARSMQTVPTNVSNTHISWQAPRTLNSILRHRELGFSNPRTPNPALLPEELRHRVLDTLGPRQSYNGTSGEVNHVAWASNGFVFACGSITITDALSMQYNKPYNLLLGDVRNNVVQELPEHHVARPKIQSGIGNINGTASMRESQDSRLFMTVATVAFSPGGDRLFSAGEDGAIRVYDTSAVTDRAVSSSKETFSSRSTRPQISQRDIICSQVFKRPAAIDLLSVSCDGLVAAASRESMNGSLNVYHRNGELFEHAHSPTHPSSSLPIYPTSLKWSPSYLHRHLLLAGFASDALNEENVKAGEICLWDSVSQARIPVGSTFSNVFDVAWNPNPGPTSTLFAVASVPSTSNQSIGKGVRSVVQCFAPKTGRVKRVVEFDCPALDINDVVFNPYDDNLIAAGATDGKVYVWDKRFADQRQDPLHVFAHDATLNVIDHERDLEEGDTGVRFLSWGATSSRLYSGSSDGVVKIWDPYRATEDCHIQDAGTFTSAIMSGAFSPDFSELLIGEDQGQINLLGIGCEGKHARAAKQFRLQTAAIPENKDNISGYDVAREMVDSGKVELRPMGNLPKRQVVQGRNYDGPFLMPSSDETNAAEFELNQSLQAQHHAHYQATATTSQESDPGVQLQTASSRVCRAQKTMIQLENRRIDSAQLVPQAAELQRQFQRAQRNFLAAEANIAIPIAPCKLDCNFLPTCIDEGKAADNERSKTRIPSALWHSSQQLNLDQSLLSLAELADYGLTEKCTRCFFGAAAETSVGRPAICESCTSKGKDTGICCICEGATQNLKATCERCDFACFRCDRPAEVLLEQSCISCAPCGLTWRADVLGYTPIGFSNERLDELDDRLQRLQVHDDDYDIGTTEIERLASKCQDASLAEEPKSVKRLYRKH